ncbi:hypothetical protein AAFC00_005673 [Neodothiora populina]|uniref:Uncharacterized protein n=1 Tax=Neodothiora populina TaxID=2781224 RepID=A0ABR3P6T1_9PEZI
MSTAFDKCTAVSVECPVEATIYGYALTPEADIFFAVILVLCGLVRLVLGVKCKTWTFLVAVIMGCLLEFLGYIGRVMMHDNAWTSSTSRFMLRI